MTSNELPENVRALIARAVPTIDALELLLQLVREPARSWTAAELSAGAPAGVREPGVAAFLDTLRAQNLVEEREPARYVYHAGTPALQQAVAGLLTAYRERPVTLIRTIYAIADSRAIQSFADAFKLKRDKER